MIRHAAKLSPNQFVTRSSALVVLLVVACAPAPAALESIERSVEAGVLQTYVAYPSGDLHVTGWLFEDPADPSPRPLVIFNHGGVAGVGEGTRQLCRWLVQNGFTVFAPSYRGEDGSEGEIEVAVGEVDDVLNAAMILESHPSVDSARLLLAGTSHGALVSLKAACRPVICERLQGVVAGYGVTDIYAWYQYLVDNDFDVRDPLSLRIYGDGPSDRPDAFAERHLPNFLDELCPAPVLVVQGGLDRIVPAFLAESLMEQLRRRGRDQDELALYESGGHGFLFWDDPELHDEEELVQARQARSRLLDFLTTRAGIGQQ